MSVDADRLIGYGLCPVCGKAGARWSVMKTRRACVTHNGCSQVQIRGDDADQIIRDRRTSGDLTEPTAAPAVVPTPEPAPTAIAEPAPEPAPPKRAGWGVLAW